MNASRRTRVMAAVVFAVIALGLVAWWLTQQMAHT
jgi:hypothetical protein